MAVTFATDIKPYFTECYRKHMMDSDMTPVTMDLWSATDVKAQFNGIRRRVSSGSMPPDADQGCEGSWDDAKKKEFLGKFDKWKDDGFLP